jgi:hypothetical protein
MPKTITLRINEPLLKRFKKHAEIENRSLSNFIETATIKYLEEIELADDFELEDLLSNKDLNKRLKKGSDDASKKRGKFVTI